MPQGPFASSVGVGRAEPEWAEKNLVKDICGTDRIHAKGEKSEAPLDLGADVMSGDLSTCPKEVDLLIVGAGLSVSYFVVDCAFVSISFWTYLSLASLRRRLFCATGMRHCRKMLQGIWNEVNHH